MTKDGKVYSILELYQLPPIMFSEGQANAIILAVQLVRKATSLIRLIVIIDIGILYLHLANANSKKS